MNLFRKKDQFKKGSTRIMGHNFTVLDPISMPKVRQAAYHLNEYEKGWGITKENLMLAFSELRKGTDYPRNWRDEDDLIAQLTDKLKDMTGLIDMMTMVIKQDFQFDPVIKSACNIILLDDEKADVIDPVIQQEKLALCQKHDEIMIFFLITERNSMQTIEHIFDTLKTLDSSTFPKKEMMTEKRLLSMIGKEL